MALYRTDPVQEVSSALHELAHDGEVDLGPVARSGPESEVIIKGVCDRIAQSLASHPHHNQVHAFLSGALDRLCHAREREVAAKEMDMVANPNVMNFGLEYALAIAVKKCGILKSVLHDGNEGDVTNETYKEVGPASEALETILRIAPEDAPVIVSNLDTSSGAGTTVSGNITSPTTDTANNMAAFNPNRVFGVETLISVPENVTPTVVSLTFTCVGRDGVSLTNTFLYNLIGRGTPPFTARLCVLFGADVSGVRRFTPACINQASVGVAGVTARVIAVAGSNLPTYTATSFRPLVREHDAIKAILEADRSLKYGGCTTGGAANGFVGRGRDKACGCK